MPYSRLFLRQVCSSYIIVTKHAFLFLPFPPSRQTNIRDDPGVMERAMAKGTRPGDLFIVCPTNVDSVSGLPQNLENFLSLLPLVLSFLPSLRVAPSFLS